MRWRRRRSPCFTIISRKGEYDLDSLNTFIYYRSEGGGPELSMRRTRRRHSGELLQERLQSDDRQGGRPETVPVPLRCGAGEISLPFWTSPHRRPRRRKSWQRQLKLRQSESQPRKRQPLRRRQPKRTPDGQPSLR